ncbi:MAG TPA: hypothetical protein VHL11_01845, partial [Phototrophicaceae bacterium]|nr:hypothetical protein [Phototrophicaceae bacterium]
HELVRMESEGHNLVMREDHVQTLLHRTGGLPLAIIRTIARMAWRGSSVETELQHLEDPDNEIYDFCFSKTIALIQPGDGFLLFMSLAIFAADVSREALGFVAGFGSDVLTRDEGLSDLEVLSLCHKNQDCFGIEPLTRTQALRELGAHPNFKAEACERWVKWYLNFTARYGGRDGLEMHLRYDYLEQDWNNVLAVLNWCINQGRYDDLLILWNNVRDFTHIYGFWADRLNLLDWLVVEANNRLDYPTVVQTMYDRAFTLTLTGPTTRLEEADALLQRCWTLRHYAPPALQARVAALTASLYIKYRKLIEAHQWLDTGEAILRASKLEPIELARERTSLLYDRGENWLLMGEYTKAQETFEDMLEQGKTSGWQRSIAYAENWLAYTALFQKNADVSKQYMEHGWTVASRIKEKRLTAYFKRTFAYYYYEIAQQKEAFRWAEDALDTFERLGMLPDTREMQEFIERLKVN